MAFDFKREYREFYMPKAKPELVDVPEMNYVAVRGTGDPNEPDGAYKQALGVLYAVSYTLKMSRRSGYVMEGGFDYVVPPLEGFWETDGGVIDYSQKGLFRWISAIRLPDFVTRRDFDWAVETASEKKKLDCSAAEFLTLREGLCVQMLHVGPYDNEPESVALMDAYALENGCAVDITAERLHHEIYLSDPRRTAPEKLRTVIRHPVKKLAPNSTGVI